MELRIEIGSNLRKILEKAGNLNEKWEDLMYSFKEFMANPKVDDLEITLSESDKESGTVEKKVRVSKLFKEVKNEFPEIKEPENFKTKSLQEE